MTAQNSTFERLNREHGQMVSGHDLVKLAGFSTTDALRMAYHRGTVGFSVFRIEGRRGFFAKTADVAQWLDSIGTSNPASCKEDDMT